MTSPAYPTPPSDTSTTESTSEQLERLSLAVVKAINAHDFSFQSAESQDFTAHLAPDFRAQVDTNTGTKKPVSWVQQVDMWRQRCQEHPNVHFKVVQVSSTVDEPGRKASVFIDMEDMDPGPNQMEEEQSLQLISDVEDSGKCENDTNDASKSAEASNSVERLDNNDLTDTASTAAHSQERCDKPTTVVGIPLSRKYEMNMAKQLFRSLQTRVKDKKNVSSSFLSIESLDRIVDLNKDIKIYAQVNRLREQAERIEHLEGELEANNEQIGKLEEGDWNMQKLIIEQSQAMHDLKTRLTQESERAGSSQQVIADLRATKVELERQRSGLNDVLAAVMERENAAVRRSEKRREALLKEMSDREKAEHTIKDLQRRLCTAESNLGSQKTKAREEINALKETQSRVVQDAFEGGKRVGFDSAVRCNGTDLRSAEEWGQRQVIEDVQRLLGGYRSHG